ncbi:MAG: hypothetical protein IT368_02795 [Candidatus Hydrogenedentes bacterium]|nr:hypothetical protein [Candidatus Hydrogenedentota bacterium]
MADDALKHRLRLILSHKEKARRLRGQTDRSYARSEITREDYEAQMAVYAEHTRTAEAALKGLRRDQANKLEVKAALLRTLLQQRMQVSDKNTRKAQRMDRQLEKVREQIGYYNRLLSVDSSDQVGGFLDLPLESYQRTARRGRNRLFYFSRSDRVTMIVAGIVSVAAIIIVYLILRSGGDLAFNINRNDPYDGPVTLQVHNPKSFPVELIVPWHADSHTGSAATVGIELHGRDPESDTFKVLPAMAGVWVYENTPVEVHGPIVIQPGMTETLILHPRALLQKGLPVDSLRITAHAGNGNTLFERNLTIQPAPEPQPKAPPARQGLVRVPTSSR